jgi:signal transduction histidine kinase
MDVTDRRRAEEERQALAHANRITTMGQLTASIAHEVNQPIAAVVTNAQAALRWLDMQPPDPQEVRQALGRIIKDGGRAGDVIGRIRALIAKAPARKDRLEINNTILEVIARENYAIMINIINGLSALQIYGVLVAIGIMPFAIWHQSPHSATMRRHLVRRARYTGRPLGTQPRGLI